MELVKAIHADSERRHFGADFHRIRSWRRKREVERGALARRRLHPNVSAVSLNDLSANSKTDSAPRDLRAVKSLKRLKNSAVIFGCDTNTVVRACEKPCSIALLSRNVN